MTKVRVGNKGRARKHYVYLVKDEYYKKDAGEVVYSTYGNLPKFAQDNPKLFFETADLHERANGTAYREHIIALPRELTPQERIDFVDDWISQEMSDKYAYQAVIHNKTALDGGEQPHLHLMFSERHQDGIDRPAEQFFKRYNSKNPSKGGCRKDNTGLKPAQRRELLKATRQRSADMLNEHLLKRGFIPSVDNRNWVQRGLDKKPHNMSFAMISEPTVRKAYSEYATEKRELNELLKTTDLTIAPEPPKPTANTSTPSKPRFF